MRAHEYINRKKNNIKRNSNSTAFFQLLIIVHVLPTQLCPFTKAIFSRASPFIRSIFFIIFIFFLFCFLFHFHSYCLTSYFFHSVIKFSVLIKLMDADLPISFTFSPRLTYLTYQTISFLFHGLRDGVIMFQRSHHSSSINSW